MTRILVAYDGSQSAMRALERAAGLMRPGDEVDVIAVGRWNGHDAEAYRTALADGRALLAKRGIAAGGIQGRGDPGVAICEAARLGYDLLVVGSRQLNVVERAVIGSTSTWVAHHTDCDVLIAK